MYRTVLQVRNQLQIRLLKKSAHRVLTEPLHSQFVYVIFNETLSLSEVRVPFSTNYVSCVAANGVACAWKYIRLNCRETIPLIEA